LQYLRARYYDSSQGRFTTKDTLLGSTDKPITLNLYTYCGNNPLNITDPSGHGWWSNAVNSVKSAAKTAGNWANKNIVQPVKSAANTAKNWANNNIVQPVKSFINNTKQAASDAYQKGKQYVEKKCQQVQQGYNQVTNYVSNKAQQFYNDYVPPKMQKAIEEAKKFVCTTTDRIVKDAKEFIQNVDWKKVAIGVAATAAITLAVVATGGAAAPVLIGAAVGAGISTGTTVVSGVIQGKSPAEIAQDASGAFMWGAIGGAVGGGTTQVLKNVGSKVIGKVGKKVIENGVDMVVDLTQTATENGGLTGKDVLLCATMSFGGELLGSVKTNSTTRNQLIDGVTDNKSVKNAVKDSASDATNTGLKNGSRLKTNDALDAAEDFLGKGYTDAGNGRFISADGTKVVRMGDNDILGKHGGGPHMNFETMAPNPSKPGKMQVVDNMHIYLED
ncbi:MAG: RHS repeat-associated core domain-containing protein, partial [Eubacterium sp.]|nr:RHS repeat-associated core domain-containing protein [Eubacterium sp.]